MRRNVFCRGRASKPSTISSIVGRFERRRRWSRSRRRRPSRARGAGPSAPRGTPTSAGGGGGGRRPARHVGGRRGRIAVRRGRRAAAGARSGRTGRTRTAARNSASTSGIRRAAAGCSSRSSRRATPAEPPMFSNRRPPLIVRRGATAKVSPAKAANDRWRQIDAAAGSVKSQMRAVSPLTSSPTRPANTDCIVVLPPPTSTPARNRVRAGRTGSGARPPTTCDRCRRRAGAARATGPSFSRSTMMDGGAVEIAGALARACRRRTRESRRRRPSARAATPPARAARCFAAPAAG